MTAYNLTVGSIAVPKSVSGPGVFRVEKLIDFDDTPYVSGDVLSLFNVAAGLSVLTAGYRLLRAEGATSAGHSMGDTGSATQWIASFDANATAGATQCATSGWEHYTADNFVKCTLGADIAYARIVFFAWMLNCGLDFATGTPLSTPIT